MHGVHPNIGFAGGRHIPPSHTDTGVCNPRDFIALLLQACVLSGCYPSDVAWSFDITPVDYLASCIVALATHGPEFALGRVSVAVLLFLCGLFCSFFSAFLFLWFEGGASGCVVFFFSLSYAFVFFFKYKWI